MRRYEQRRSPVEPVQEFFCSVTGDIERVDRYIHDLLRAFIKAGGEALRVGEHDVWIGRIWRDIAAFTAADCVPVLAADHAFVVIAVDGNRAVVLLRAVDAIRPAIVGDHVIELRRRLIVLRASRSCRRRWKWSRRRHCH